MHLMNEDLARAQHHERRETVRQLMVLRQRARARRAARQAARRAERAAQQARLVLARQL